MKLVLTNFSRAINYAFVFLVVGYSFACIPALAQSKKVDSDAPRHLLRRVDMDCSHHQYREAFRRLDGDASNHVDQEQLLISSARANPFAKSKKSSEDWLHKALVSHGYKGSFVQMSGASQVAVRRIASLAHNEYIIASQMAYGIHMRQGVLDKDVAMFMGWMLLGLTEDSDQTPETNMTNGIINDSMVYIEKLSPTVKGYARWAIRAFAFDDQVAIDASMAGVCMSSPSKAELESLGKAIRNAQFDPKRDYVSRTKLSDKVRH